MRGYTIRGKGGRVRYVGVTNNPRRRAAQHQRSGKRGRLKVETGGMSRGKARRWEGGEAGPVPQEQQRPQPDLQQDQKRWLEVLTTRCA